MTTLELKYNSFAVKTDFFINGKEASLRCFGTGENVRLRDYIDDFFPEAIKKSNVGPGEECIIQFYGSQDAFEDVKTSYKKYMDQAEEGMKIELPEHKPYPNSNNFHEINKLIDAKRDFFYDQIKDKREEMINPSTGKSNIELTDVEKRFDKDKKAFMQIYDENLEKAKSVIEKASFNTTKEEFIVSTVTMKKPADLTSEDVMTKIGTSFFFESNINHGVNSLDIKEVKKAYDEIIKKINSSYEKYCGELTDLLLSLYEKLDNALCSRVETNHKDYTALHSDCLTFNYVLHKNKQKNTFDIAKTIPDSCFSTMELEETSSTVRIGIYAINETISDVTSSCQEYINSISILNVAKQAFLDEAEKCKAYYLEQLQELQETIKEKLISTKQIEEEITALENRIVGLNALQSEIIKLAVS